MKIVVRQVSGLGNQLSQYAAGRYFASRYGASMEVAVDPAAKAMSHGHPRPFLLSKFFIKCPYRDLDLIDRLLLVDREGLRPVTKRLQHLAGVQVVREPFAERYTFHPDLAVRRDMRRVYLLGYWQAGAYAEAVSAELRNELRYREPAKGKNLEVFEHIQGVENSVSLHIRRGDYTLAAEGNIALPLRYYHQSIEWFRTRLNDPTFFVFSDDMEFARKNLPSRARTVFVDHNDSSSAHEDLRLMSNCRNHIIANSTFSWWGAWLNSRSDKIVYAPKYWLLNRESYFPEIFPEGWILSEVHEQGASASTLA